MNRVLPFRPKLIVNRDFIAEFIAAPTPCLGLGLVEEQGTKCGLLALRPEADIPSSVSASGMSFGHALLGNSRMEVIHFGFHFYGFKTYNVLINPNNSLVKQVLGVMLETRDYFFFALDNNSHVTAFRSDIHLDTIRRLRQNMDRIDNSKTTNDEYEQFVSTFAANPDPPGIQLTWVCRDNLDYLNLEANPLDLNPS